MDPSFLMATLICLIETKHAEKDCEGSMHAELPFIFGTQRVFENLHTSDHSPGTPPGPHNGAEPSGIGKFVFDERSFNNADGSKIAARLAAPCGTKEVPSNQIDMFL